MSLLNLHEDERCKPAAWLPVGWIPNYIDARAKGLRPTRGYESMPARKMRLFHRCWIEFLDGWAERTRDAMILTWADGVQRSSRIFLGGLLGDQQEGDKFTGEPATCHRCFAARKDYLVPDAHAPVKSSKRMRLRVESAASGCRPAPTPELGPARSGANSGYCRPALAVTGPSPSAVPTDVGPPGAASSLPGPPDVGPSGTLVAPVRLTSARPERVVY